MVFMFLVKQSKNNKNKPRVRVPMSLSDANGYTRLQTSSVREMTTSSPDSDKKEEEELKEPEPYNERSKSSMAGVSCFFWAQLILIGLVSLCLYSLYTVVNTPATATHKPLQYQIFGVLMNVMMALFGWVLLLSIMSFAASDHNTVLETLHAHRMETYRLHKELLRAKKD
jgi:hypothetical protein